MESNNSPHIPRTDIVSARQVPSLLPVKAAFNPGDPVTSERLKASITDMIAKRVIGFSREEIALRVDIEYERLLSHASILTHIPSLTAGLVMRELRAARSGPMHHQIPDSAELQK